MDGGGHLRHPVFLRLRDDKTVDECFRPGEESAEEEKPGAGGETPRSSSSPTSTRFSGRTRDHQRRPDRILPRGVALDAALSERPPPGARPLSRTASRENPSFRRSWETAADHYRLRSTRKPASLVNLGAIPFHIWSSRLVRSRPAGLVHPGPRSQDGAVRARGARSPWPSGELCEEIELEGFIKTSGGSGLHILLPMGGAVRPRSGPPTRGGAGAGDRQAPAARSPPRRAPSRPARGGSTWTPSRTAAASCWPRPTPSVPGREPPPRRPSAWERGERRLDVSSLQPEDRSETPGEDERRSAAARARAAAGPARGRWSCSPERSSEKERPRREPELPRAQEVPAQPYGQAVTSTSSRNQPSPVIVQSVIEVKPMRTRPAGAAAGAAREDVAGGVEVHGGVGEGAGVPVNTEAPAAPARRAVGRDRAVVGGAGEDRRGRDVLVVDAVDGQRQRAAVVAALERPAVPEGQPRRWWSRPAPRCRSTPLGWAKLKLLLP